MYHIKYLKLAKKVVCLIAIAVIPKMKSIKTQYPVHPKFMIGFIFPFNIKVKIVTVYFVHFPA